ncbi:hypothetical protein ACHAWF_011907 [Thalassiosira exigua]
MPGVKSLQNDSTSMPSLSVSASESSERGKPCDIASSPDIYSMPSLSISASDHIGVNNVALPKPSLHEESGNASLHISLEGRKSDATCSSEGIQPGVTIECGSKDDVSIMQTDLPSGDTDWITNIRQEFSLTQYNLTTRDQMSAPYLHTSHRVEMRQQNTQCRLLREADCRLLREPLALPVYYQEESNMLPQVKKKQPSHQGKEQLDSEPSVLSRQAPRRSSKMSEMKDGPAKANKKRNESDITESSNKETPCEQRIPRCTHASPQTEKGIQCRLPSDASVSPTVVDFSKGEAKLSISNEHLMTREGSGPFESVDEPLYKVLAVSYPQGVQTKALAKAVTNKISLQSKQEPLCKALLESTLPEPCVLREVAHFGTDDSSRSAPLRNSVEPKHRVNSQLQDCAPQQCSIIGKSVLEATDTNHMVKVGQCFNNKLDCELSPGQKMAGNASSPLRYRTHLQPGRGYNLPTPQTHNSTTTERSKYKEKLESLETELKHIRHLLEDTKIKQSTNS